MCYKRTAINGSTSGRQTRRGRRTPRCAAFASTPVEARLRPGWKKTGRCAVGHAAPCLRAASSDATRTRGNARPNADRLVRSSKPLLRVRPPTGSLPENTDAMRVSRQGSGNSSLRSYKCVLATNKKKKGQNAALSGASTLEAAILRNNANSPKNDTRD